MSRLNPPSPRQIYDLCVAIEKLPASPEQTAAVTLASSMLAPGIRIDLGWDQEAAQPEPAAPAVGEDEALLARLEAVRMLLLNFQGEAIFNFHANEAKWIGEAMSRLRAALSDAAHTRKALERAQGAEADLARLVNERDRALADVERERERADTNLANAREVQRKWCDESNRALRLENELDEARAALAAAVAEESRLQSLIDCACNALTDSICVSGNDSTTNLQWVGKLRREAIRTGSVRT